MDEIAKTYTIPTKRFTNRLLHRLANVNGKLNSCKIGRIRRGGVLFCGFGASRNEDRTITITVRLRKRPADLRVQYPKGGERRFCLYDHGDIAKVLKDLTVAARKAEVTP